MEETLEKLEYTKNEKLGELQRLQRERSTRNQILCEEKNDSELDVCAHEDR